MVLKKMDEFKLNEIDILQKILRETENKKQAELIKMELNKIKKGLNGEKQTSYFIDFNIGESKNYVILHDLRLELNERTAQIDHMLISKTMGIVLVEVKNTDAVVTINDDGSMLYVFKSGKKFNMASPLEQSKRHELVVKEFLKNNNIEMEVSSTVVFLPEIIITNKKLPKSFYRADTFIESLKNDKIENPFNFIKLLAKVVTNNIVSFEHLMYIGGLFVKEHKPVAIDYKKKYPITKDKKEESKAPVVDEVEKTIIENEIEKKCRENNIDVSDFKDIKLAKKYMGNEMVSFACMKCNKIQRKSLKTFIAKKTTCENCSKL